MPTPYQCAPTLICPWEREVLGSVGSEREVLGSVRAVGVFRRVVCERGGEREGDVSSIRSVGVFGSVGCEGDVR